MSFLRSVIADARPRKPMLEPSENPSALTGWMSRGLDGDVSGAEEKSSGTADKTSHLSTSLHILEGASDFNTRDAPAFQADNPVNQDIQDMASNVEPESPLSVPVDKSGPIPDEESSTRLDTDIHPDRESDSEGDKASKAEGSMTPQPADTVIPDSGMNSPMSQGHDLSIAFPETHDARNRASGHKETEPVSSPASIRDMSGKETTDNDGNSALQAEEGAGQPGVHETTSSVDEGNTPAQGEVAGATAADVRPHSESSIKDPETLTIQADTTQATRLDTGDPPDRESGPEGNKASKTEASMTPQPAGTVIPDSGMNSPMSQSHDLSIAFPETHDARNRASGHKETEPVSSPASVRDMSGKELTDNDVNSALQVGEGAGQLGVHETTSSAVEGNTPAKGAVAGATAADVRLHSESSFKDPETLTIQADATRTTALTSPESSRRIESDNSAGRNEAGKALADGGKARHVSPSDYKQANMKSLADQEETLRLQKPDAAKGVLRNVQLVSRQAMVMESHVSSDMELASIPQSADRKVSISASSPGSGSSKPSSAVQHIAKPARPSASPQALRSVPARPFHADLMPKDGDSIHSRAPLRSPEKKHEAPKVQIGQIDVIIEAAAQPVTKQAPAPSPIDLASRLYLRRL